MPGQAGASFAPACLFSAGRGFIDLARGPALLPIDSREAVAESCRGLCNGRRRARGARADRRREAGADHPGPRATARNGRGRARGAESCRSSTLPRSCPTAGSWCPWCRSTPGSCCRSSRATACNGRGGARGAGRASTAGKLLPIIQGHGWQRPRWCPSCRSTPGRWCRSSTWLRGPGLLPMIDAGKLLPALATVAVVPAVPIDSRERRADHRPGCAVRACCR